MNTQIISLDVLRAFIQSLLSNPSMAIGILFVGDRMSCITEALGIFLPDGDMVGVATIARNGEQDSGTPTIVAIYILKKYRGQGYAQTLLHATINYMIEHAMTPIHIDALHSSIISIVQALPKESTRYVNVVDNSRQGAYNAMMEV